MTEETRQTIEHSPGVKINLTRGAKGEYRWELDIRDNDDDIAFDRVDRLDTRMQERWGDKKEPIATDLEKAVKEAE